MKLDRADKLVKGLAGEYVRWQASIGEFNAALIKVTGDALMAAAFLSYAGPFETSYRASLMASWTKSVVVQKRLYRRHQFVTFLAKATDIARVDNQGSLKTIFPQNGVILVVRSLASYD